MHIAADKGHVCRLIIENVQVINPRNEYGWTPLHEAAASGHLDICRLIVDNCENPKWEILGQGLQSHDYDPECRSEAPDGKTPLDMARSKEQIVKLFEQKLQENNK